MRFRKIAWLIIALFFTQVECRGGGRGGHSRGGGIRISSFGGNTYKKASVWGITRSDSSYYLNSKRRISSENVNVGYRQANHKNEQTSKSQANVKNSQGSVQADGGNDPHSKSIKDNLESSYSDINNNRQLSRFTEDISSQAADKSVKLPYHTKKNLNGEQSIHFIIFPGLSTTLSGNNSGYVLYSNKSQRSNLNTTSASRGIGYDKLFRRGFGNGFENKAVIDTSTGFLLTVFFQRIYYVYNYNNNPEVISNDITILAKNIITCSEEINALCALSTASLCTSNGKIMCVALLQDTIPCYEYPNGRCVLSDAFCTESETCDAEEIKNSKIKIPCVADANIMGHVRYSSVSLPTGSTRLVPEAEAVETATLLCIITMALPRRNQEKYGATLSS